MPAIVRMLRNEIERLNAERSELVFEKSQAIATLDGRIADIDQRLGAAERMLNAYADNAVAAEPPPAGAAISDDLMASVGTVEIPAILLGRKLHRSSKKARIIRATKALLRATGAADRDEIVQFLRQLGIMAGEKNPKAYLSVILSYAREIFETNGSVWSLRGGSSAADRDFGAALADRSGAPARGGAVSAAPAACRRPSNRRAAIDRSR